MSVPSSLLNAILALRTTAERELAAALAKPVHDAVMSWPTYERESSFTQTVNLGEGRDCNYDRPTVGVAYSTWYMPRRIQDAIRALAPIAVATAGGDLPILDLGCGTGATWWACRYLVKAMQACGMAPPSIRISACDISAPMLELAQTMWDSLDNTPQSHITVDSSLTSWTNVTDVPPGSVIVASYLMDQSDRYRIEELGRNLRTIAERCMSTTVIVVGANNKRKTTSLGIHAFLGDSALWTPNKDTVLEPVWTGSVEPLRRLRAEFAAGCTGVTATYSQGKPPSWNPDMPDFHVLVRADHQSLLPMDVAIETFVLDEAQEIAATPDERLTAILGAAGSGKSRVLVERIVRSAVSDLRNPTFNGKYLVTCFNKLVVRQLLAWFQDRASTDQTLAGRVVVAHNNETVTLWGRVEIKFLSWDTVINRFFDIESFSPSDESEESMRQVINNWSRKDVANAAWLNDNQWATPKFVLQELKRVIYGQSISTLERYLVVTRRGRPSTPQMNERQRRGLWNMLNSRDRKKLWVDRRIDAYRRVSQGYRPNQFDRIFLDECQDFVEADFKLLAALAMDSHRIVVSGDGTQAMQTGSGYFRPGQVGNARWKTHELVGSYRLPIRVCEAIEPVARAIQDLRHGQINRSEGDSEDEEDITLPQSVKSAVIGCRPIVIAPSAADVEEQIAKVLAFVSPLVRRNGVLQITNADLGNRRITQIIERANSTWRLGYLTEPATMLQIKGLERPCVFFSTRFNNSWTPGAATYEWVYTILTRTTSVLIVLLSSDTPKDLQAMVGRMRKDCLFFWDQQAEDRFDQFAAVVGTEEDPFA